MYLLFSLPCAAIVIITFIQLRDHFLKGNGR